MIKFAVTAVKKIAVSVVASLGLLVPAFTLGLVASTAASASTVHQFTVHVQGAHQLLTNGVKLHPGEVLREGLDGKAHTVTTVDPVSHVIGWVDVAFTQVGEVIVVTVS